MGGSWEAHGETLATESPADERRTPFFCLQRRPYIEIICQPARGGGKTLWRTLRFVADGEDFVPITGVVHLRTSLGIFLAVEGLRVFIPANCTSTPSRVFEPAETVTIEVQRSYAQRRGLIT